MKFGRFILRKIIEVVATKCHILLLKCTKFDFGWDSTPDRSGGRNLQHSPDLLTGFKGLLLREERG